MEVLVTSLDALLQKATNANLERPDPAALEAFCTVLADSPNGPYIATRVIAARIRSPHPTEALLTLEVLDACMKRCDVVFHAEVDKFRFLNEMIKLVSPKYYGNKTAPAVRQKVLALMHSWTIDYPRELKIKDAYEMLKKQGVVKNIPPPAPAEETASAKPRSKDALFADEEKSKVLQKLLQSKNPEDLQAANRLIKTMVREGERRVEAVTKLATEVQTVNNNVRLLDEMLDQYRPSKSSPDDLELIKELYLECHRLRPTVFKLAAETQQSDDMLNEIIEVSDELGRVLDKYSTIILNSKTQTNVTNQSDLTLVNGSGSSLLDFASPSQVTPQMSTSQIDKQNNSNLEVLGDIFSSVNCPKEVNESTDVNSAPVLKPVSLMSSSSLGIETSTNLKINDQTINKGLEELNALGSALLKSSLPSSCKPAMQFNSQRSEKLSMNLLAQSSKGINAIPTKDENIIQSNPNDLLDLDYLISKTLQSEGKSHIQNSLNDDAMVDLSSDENFIDAKSKSIKDESDVSLIEYIKSLNTKDESSDAKNMSEESEEKLPEKTIETPKTKKSSDIKPLTDISISLESIKPGSRTPMTIFEECDGITIVLHFTANKPRPDVCVIVVSITSRNSSPITDFKFQAVVPKDCKVRLLPASENSFPAFSPFLPPAAITQVMLIARPPIDNPPDVFLKFVITYVCQDDTISEIGEIKSLPLNDNLQA